MEPIALLLGGLTKKALERWLRGETDDAPIQTGITEKGFDVFEIPQPAIPFENRGTAPYTVKREFSAEWTQTLEIRQEDRRMQHVSVSAEPLRWAKLEASAEKAITQTYAVTRGRRETTKTEIAFDVPAGVRRDLHLIHRQIWRHGSVDYRLRGLPFSVPFRVLTEMEIGYRLSDLAA